MAVSLRFRSRSRFNLTLKETRKLFPLFFLFSFLLLSCAHTIKEFTQNPDFRLQNQPQRTLKFMIVTEDLPDKEHITQWLETCGRTIDEQVGIQLQATRFVQAGNLPAVNDIGSRLTALYSVGDDQKDWDIMINLSNYGIGDLAVGLVNLIFPVPMLQGYIDDTYRRIIVLKSRDCRTFIHEFFHAFIFSHDHSDGVMSGVAFQILPFTPPLNNTLYLNEGDRTEVLKNKWRNFSARTQLSLDASKDLIRNP